MQKHTQHTVGMFRCLCASHHLEGLNEGPQQDADGVALSQQLDETSGSEQPQKTQVDHLVLGEKAAAVRRGTVLHTDSVNMHVDVKHGISCFQKGNLRVRV